MSRQYFNIFALAMDKKACFFNNDFNVYVFYAEYVVRDWCFRGYFWADVENDFCYLLGRNEADLDRSLGRGGVRFIGECEPRSRTHYKEARSNVSSPV